MKNKGFHKFVRYLFRTVFLWFLFITQTAFAAPFRIVQIGDSHVAGGIFPEAARRQIQSYWGDQVTYRYLGKNGATIDYFLKPEIFRKVEQMQPDLLVVSVGTNESYGNFNPRIYVRKLDRFMTIYSRCGNRILMTTLPGNYRKGRLNPLNETVADTQIWFSKIRGIPVWDLYHGVNPEYWMNHGMMDSRGVHFTRKGYEIQGKMLGNSLIRYLQ